MVILAYIQQSTDLPELPNYNNLQINKIYDYPQ